MLRTGLLRASGVLMVMYWLQTEQLACSLGMVVLKLLRRVWWRCWSRPLLLSAWVCRLNESVFYGAGVFSFIITIDFSPAALTFFFFSPLRLLCTSFFTFPFLCLAFAFLFLLLLFTHTR